MLTKKRVGSVWRTYVDELVVAAMAAAAAAVVVDDGDSVSSRAKQEMFQE